MKIGFLSLPISGHLNPLLALARTLKARGHQPVYIGLTDCAAAAQAAGIDFVPHSEQEFPPGSVARTWGPVATMHGMDVMRYNMTEIAAPVLTATLAHLPDAIEKSGVEALVVDPIYFFVELVALNLRLPYVQVCTVLHLDPSGATPPSLFSWPPEDTPAARARNLEGMQQVGSYLAAVAPIAAAFAAKAGLDIDLRNPGATGSKLAYICQTPKEFDFPGIPWPPTFHYAGPLVDDTGRAPIPFSWEQLDDRPLIYASLGTLLNGQPVMHRAILDAAARLPDYQLVFSLGNNVSAADLGSIPANAIVVASAPQLELLKRAALCITHAGLNTALECLSAGVPMVAIPIGFDQPGVAARIAYHGVGEFLEVDVLSADALLGLIKKVLSTSSYREKAAYFREVLKQTDGRELAADAVEQAFGLLEARA